MWEDGGIEYEEGHASADDITYSETLDNETKAGKYYGGHGPKYGFPCARGYTYPLCGDWGGTTI